MLQKLKSNYLTWILLLGAFFLLLDIFFFNRGIIFSLIVAAGMIYLGRKWMPKSSGKLMFAAGVIVLIFTALSMLSVKFILLAFLGVYIYQYAQRRKNPEVIMPDVQLPQGEKARPVKVKPLFHNKIIGRQKTPDHEYEWHDINIQTGVGDAIIDLSYTVLPKEESVIFIRNLLGKVTILVPYDIELSIHHSVLYGSAKILGYEESPITNRIVTVQTEGYEEAKQKVKVFTSLMIGDIEVKRV